MSVSPPRVGPAESDPDADRSSSAAEPDASDPSVDSGVRPHGSDPGVRPHGSDPISTIRRIAEEEFILVVLLGGFALIFLLIFPPSLLVNDSWLNLMAGREVWENGLPDRDTLTVYGAGSTWTDQQWLAQLLFFGTYSLGGHALLAILTCAIVVTAFSIAAAAARSLGAGPRAIWVLLLPVLMAAPWAWSIRAQMVALPLYASLLWLLASEARAPTRRVWLALPILLVWAQVHGSVALGALLVVLLCAYELTRLALGRGVRPVGSDPKGRAWLRPLVLAVLAPLAVLATPYGPVTTARYYHLLLVDPPFAGRVTEWMWAKPAVNTMFFYVLVAIAIPLVWLGRRRLSVFDLAVLALTLFGAVTAIRGIVWFAMACMVFLPVAIGRKLESRNPGEPRRRFNVLLASGFAAAVVILAASSFLRGPSFYEQYWPGEPVEAVRGAVEPGDRVFAPDRFSNWLLWKIPELRGRVAYDVRFELYDEEFFDRLQAYAGETGDDWMSFADGYRIVLVDETRRSHTADFLRETGARAIYRGEEITVIVRPPA